jgi:hypothetical protein
MLVDHDELVIEVQKNSIEFAADKAKNPDGLFRIFNQYLRETYAEDEKIPVGRYRVSRTKWPFRQAVYKVHQL